MTDITIQRNLLIAQQNVNPCRNNLLNDTTGRNNLSNGDNATDDKLHAGGRYTTAFPSSCQTNTFEETLLKKKAYMFKNKNNNVLSGPIQNTLYFGGTSGTGLTRNKQLSNMAKGLMPNGTKGLRLGVQSYQNNSLYSNSNIYNNSEKGVYGPTIIEPSIKILICIK